MRSRIVLTEKVDELLFTNAGNFYEGIVDDYTLTDKTPEKYRNFFLAKAMVNLGMIETLGYGIKKMYGEQKRRFFPMPQYDLKNPDKVKLKILGKIIDENYTRRLIERTDLSLETVIYLDKVQKKEKLTKEETQKLRKQNLVEGRYPNLYISSKVAAVTEDKSLYIKHRAFDNPHYKKLIISLIKNFGSATRQDIDRLLLGKLSDVLNEEQKNKKINNLLNEMAGKDRTIKNTGSKRKPKWTLV